MKKQRTLVLLIICATLQINSILAQATNGLATNNNYNPAYYVGWNATGGSAPLPFNTNNTLRMSLMGQNPIGSITGALGLGVAAPQAYFHLANNGSGAFTPNGLLFRTDGLSTIDNSWSFWLTTNGTLGEAFRIGNVQGGGRFRMGTVADRPLTMITNDVNRVTILDDNNIPFDRSGFVGFNTDGPWFHIDVNTQNPNDQDLRGELIFRGRIADDEDAYISFVNTTTTGPIFTPTLLAHQSDNDRSALTTAGSIMNGQDVAGITEPVTRFISARAYDPVANLFNPPLVMARVNVVANRRLFVWYNGVDELMSMEANGFLGIGLSNPGNRVEINSDFYGTGGLPTGAGGGPIVTENTLNGSTGSGGNATGFSGLRFSDLRSASVPMTNPGPGVLALDDNGDVIYVDAADSGGAFGALCSNPAPNAGAITGNTKVDLNDYNLYFTENDLIGSNRVGVGYDCDVALPAKLSVRQLYDNPVNVSSVAHHAHNSDITSGVNQRYTGVVGISDGQHPPGMRSMNVGGEFHAESADVNYGVIGTADPGSMTSPNNIGGHFTARDGYTSQGAYGQGANADERNVGVYGIGTSPINPSQTENIGGEFVGAFSTGRNYGVKSVGQDGEMTFGIHAVANGGVAKYGVYGEATGSGTNFAGYFAGTVVTGQPSIPSDVQFKTNITPIGNADNLLSQINPVTYDYLQTGNAARMHFPTDLQYGMIAQEVEAVIPEFVIDATHPAETDSSGAIINPSFDFKVLNYQSFIPLLIAGHQEQAGVIAEKDAAIDSLTNVVGDLNDRLTQLENCLAGLLPTLCQMNQSIVESNGPVEQEAIRAKLSVSLTNRTAIILDQNVPNPFAEQTIINFSIPATVQKAQIHFYDNNGRILQSVDVNERGLGSLTVFGSDLSSGVYTYTLIADGHIVATKKMVKQ